MNRTELAQEYTVNEHGNITDPGKFEGEALYVPYLYEHGLEGGADDSYPAYESPEMTEDDWEGAYNDSPEVEVFYLSDDDKAEFPELVPFKVACLFESEQGFVSCELHTADQWESFRKSVGL
jgi:hypothetical protein